MPLDNTLANNERQSLQYAAKKVELTLFSIPKPRIFYLNERKIYISVTIKNQKIYLFDSQPNLFPNFSRSGNSIIDLNHMDR